MDKQNIHQFCTEFNNSVYNPLIHERVERELNNLEKNPETTVKRMIVLGRGMNNVKGHHKNKKLMLCPHCFTKNTHKYIMKSVPEKLVQEFMFLFNMDFEAEEGD